MVSIYRLGKDRGTLMIPATRRISADSDEDLELLVIVDNRTEVQSQELIAASLAQEIARARRYQHFVSLLVVSVRIPDGDGDGLLTPEYLLEFLRSNSRSVDIIAQHTSDTYALILPETSSEEAACLSKRLRDHIECLTRRENESAEVSVGVASYPSDGHTEADVIGSALGRLGGPEA